MSIRFTWALPLAAALAACQAAPLPPLGPPHAISPYETLLDGQIYPDGNPYRTLAVEELPIVAATADSSLSGFGVARLIDGDLSTQWASAIYQAPTAWARVELAASAAIASVSVKARPNTGRYDIQVSEDGRAWTTALANQANTAWEPEVKPLPAGTKGKFVRLFWRNASPPAARFAVYEIVVNGQTASTPTPSVSPTMAPSEPPPPSSTPGGVGARVAITSTSASSSYAGLPTTRAVDGNISTQWASGGYKEAEAWLRLDFGGVVDIGQIRIKTGALPDGVTYKLEVSDDGASWSPASGRLTNNTWGLEPKDVFGRGRYLRIRFLNSATAPLARFTIYEVEAYAAGGTTAPSASPSTAPSSTPSTAPSMAPGVSQYYPNWEAAPSRNYYIEKKDGRTFLRFSTAIANVGAGHIQIRGRVEGNVTHATQEVLDASGRVVETRDVGTFEYHPDHGHFHVTAVARYELRRGGATGTLLRTASKVSFCIEDSYRYISTSTESARYPDCAPTMMGITRGWADLYSAGLPGQEFDVGALPAGEYDIVIYVDPTNKFIDASRSNNVSWTKVFVDPAAGRVYRISSSS